MISIPNAIILIVSLFVFDQIYGILKRNASKIPVVTQSWLQFLTGKGPRSYHGQAFENVNHISPQACQNVDQPPFSIRKQERLIVQNMMAT
jgi:hypothetical protein